MEDQQGKYLRLFGTLFLCFLGFIASVVLLLLLVKLLFGVLSYIPWLNYMYTLAIILLPGALSISIFYIYWKRTKFHPSPVARAISYAVFAFFIVGWMGVMVYDIIHFFRFAHPGIERYLSYEKMALVSTVASIFLVGVLQALTTEKEKDWMERSKH